MEPSQERGIAATEVALALPFLVAMILVVVETANLLHTYQSVQDASREAARSVVRKGSQTDVAAVVAAMMSNLPATSTTTTVSTDAGATTVTVEVKYAYSSVLKADQLMSLLSSGPVVLSSKTSMPLQ